MQIYEVYVGSEAEREPFIDLMREWRLNVPVIVVEDSRLLLPAIRTTRHLYEGAVNVGHVIRTVEQELGRAVEATR